MELKRISRKSLALALSVAIISTGWINPRSARAATGISAIWANEGSDKVTQDDLRVAKGTNVNNSVWNGSQINIFGARNEVVNFNLILEAQSGASNVSVTFNKLTGPNGGTITSAAATGDQVFSYVNRNIELFYIRYLQINGLSLVSYNTYDERHIPWRMRRPWTGNGVGSGTWNDRPDHNKYYPEIAVPLELASTFNIASSQNQSIWCDIYIPKTAVPGVYSGTITVQESAGTHQIPVQLTVRNFTLPDTPSAKTMLYYSYTNINTRFLGTANEYPNPGTAAETQAEQIRDKYFMLAHRHRISLINDDPAECGGSSDQPCAEMVPRLNGSLFTAINGYDGPGVGIGNNVYSIGTYGSWGWQSGGQSGMNQHADAWASWFSQNSPQTEYFLYLIDESSNYSQIQTWAQYILNDTGPGHALKSMATIDLPSAAANCPALDIPTSTLVQGVASQWEPLDQTYENDSRKRFFMYNAHRPASGSTGTEDDGVSPRELAWGQYKKGVNRWFEWESTYYNNYQGGMGQTDVFHNAQTFGTSSKTDSVLGQTGWNYSNGDGVLFYPGTDMVYPASSYGVHGPFASLRLKYWRRGLQDVDYLTMAAAINPSTVQTIVNNMVPKVLWDYGVTDSSDPTWVLTDISWPYTTPDSWETARLQLANIIDGGTTSSPPGMVTGVTAAAGNGQVALSWLGVSGATSYNVYYKQGTGVTTVNGTKIAGASNPVNVTNLTNGQAYSFIVTAVNSAGEGTPSAEVDQTPLALPGTPGGLTATAGNGSVTLSWSAASGATAYNVYYTQGAGVTTSNGTRQGNAVSPQVVTGLANGLLYSFIVTGINAVGEGSPSAEADQTPEGLPGIPNGLTATAGNGQVTLSWNPVSQATSYNVYYKQGTGVTTSSGTELTGVSNPVNVTGLANGQVYSFIVTAVNAMGEGSASSELDQTPQSAPVPGIPGDLTAAAGNGSVTLGWSAVSGATSYNVYYKQGAGVTTGNGIEISGANNPAAVTGLTNGKLYSFIVTAVIGATEGSSSVEVDQTPLAPPGVPGGLTATPGDSNISLTWNPVSGAQSYNLYYKQGAGVTMANGTRLSGITAPWDVTNLANGQLYSFILTAVNSVGESSPSLEVDQAPQGLPAIPTNLTAAPSDGQIALTWDAVSNATSYNIYYSLFPGVTTTTGLKTSATVNARTLTNLTDGLAYYFAVTAVNSAGESPLSMEVSATPSAPAVTNNPPAQPGFSLPDQPVFINLQTVYPLSARLQAVSNNAAQISFTLNYAGAYPTARILSGSPSLTQSYSSISNNGWLDFSSVSGLMPGAYQVTAIGQNPAGASAPASANIFLISASAGTGATPRIYPNPWRQDKHQGDPMIFDQMNLNSTVKIFTVSGHLVRTLNAPAGGVVWDLTNDSGDRVASGLYIYLITSDGSTTRGKLAIIR